MDEQASFEARAVLPPRRARRSRAALLVPAIAFVVVAWAGLSGPRPDQSTARLPSPTAAAEPSPTAEVPYPERVIGLEVHQLDELPLRELGRNDVVAIAGWYRPTSISNCPAVAVIYRDGALPEIRPDVDALAYCDRSGILSADRPALSVRPPPKHHTDDGTRHAGPSEVAVTFILGVKAPRAIELAGADATRVVLVAHVADVGDGCGTPAGCRRVLVVDYVGWTAGA